MNKRYWDLGLDNEGVGHRPPIRSVKEFSEEIGTPYNTIKRRFRDSGSMLPIYLTIRTKKYYRQSSLIVWHNKFLTDNPKAKGEKI